MKFKTDRKTVTFGSLEVGDCFTLPGYIDRRLWMKTSKPQSNSIVLVGLDQHGGQGRFSMIGESEEVIPLIAEVTITHKE